MPKSTDPVSEPAAVPEAAPAPVVYRVQAPELKIWDKENGVWHQVPPYNGKSPDGSSRVERPTVFGVYITDNQGTTPDPRIALEFADMGWTVTPDPHEAVQNLNLVALEHAAVDDPTPENKKAVEKYARQVQEWRREHGVAVPA